MAHKINSKKVKNLPRDTYAGERQESIHESSSGIHTWETLAKGGRLSGSVNDEIAFKG